MLDDGIGERRGRDFGCAGQLAREVRLAGFGDVAVTDGFFTVRRHNKVAGDAGVGIRITHQIGQSSFQTRFDFPLYLSHPDRAVGASGPDDPYVKFRWTFSVWPAF